MTTAEPPPSDSDREEVNEDVEGGSRNVVALAVNRLNVKTVKMWLERNALFGKSIFRHQSISATSTASDINPIETEQEFVISTTIPTTTPPGLPVLSTPLELRGVEAPHTLVSTFALSSSRNPSPSSPLLAFIRSFIATNPPQPPTSFDSLLSTAPRRTSTYSPLLLLPSDAFTNSQWTAYLSLQPTFFPSLASSLNLTHVARNAPIPVSSMMRSPSLIQFFYPPTTPASVDDSFETALWVHTMQYGIHQIWAPVHTMFSRGNIREKKRLFTSLPDVAGSDVADLYSGIGYFVFSYLKAGARRVWCWEINPWSVEGLRRGCEANGWAVKVINMGEGLALSDEEDQSVKVVVFSESNEFAVNRLANLQRGRIMVKHVNLGLLPTSRGSWRTATEVVENDGWIHVHVNVGEHEIEQRVEECVQEFRSLESQVGTDRMVICEHVERVKTFAPGVLHCVFDLYIGDSK